MVAELTRFAAVISPSLTVKMLRNRARGEGAKMSKAEIKIDVNGGFYTVSEAARLLGMMSSQRIHRMISPTGGGAPPVVLRDFQKVGSQHELSFLDVIEIKFVEHFRQAKISLQSLRLAARNARDVLGVPHPFATSSVKFQTDRKKVFLETAEETGDRYLLDLMTKQVAIYEIIERSFERHLTFDVNGVAACWQPAPGEAPRVIVAPVYAFGRPVISDRKVPTRTLFDSWLSNNHDLEVVADWFRVQPDEVDEAVRFELRSLN